MKSITARIHDILTEDTTIPETSDPSRNVAIFYSITSWMDGWHPRLKLSISNSRPGWSRSPTETDIQGRRANQGREATCEDI